ncbi:MAG: ABC transporter permease [Candidatus Micrarchaeota archaeon]|nr:ABC transporter permease [Candidatus Micrarchaeota archaeon]
MKLADVLAYSFMNLRHRKLRSALTILGIVIGICAVVSLVTFGKGFQEEVNKQLGALGGRTIFVSPVASVGTASAFRAGAAPSSGKLYQKDYERLKKIAEIEEIARLLMGRTSLKFKDKEISGMVFGIEPGVFEKTTAIEIETGRFLLPSDRKVAVIGNTISESAFGQNNKVGLNSYIEISGQKFRVIGIMKKSGNAFSGGRVDSAIYIPFEDARQLFRSTFKEGEIGAMAVLIREGADAEEVSEKMRAELDASRKVKPDERDYSVVNPKTIQDAINQVLGLVTLFVGTIAGISLVVGGLAIASSMFTAVVERTKEIGILKSIGATQEDIMRIFIFEAGILGGIGGLIGVLVAFGIVYLANSFGVPSQIDLFVGLFGVSFAFLVGVLAGLVPARNAAKLSPVEALRYD